MRSAIIKRWSVRLLLVTGALLALGMAAPEASAGFNLSIGTGGFYFSVGHHDYYPYYHQPARYGRYATTSFSFHSTLSDYGYWQYSPEMGVEVWIPYVEYGWRPYTYGHWTYSPYGWTWVAYEPWGWIPHHYGNWTYVDHYGWAWVPGYTWRPHCVHFAVFDGYIGWAPVAPPWYRYSYNRDYYYRGGRGHHSGWHHGHRSHGYSGIDYSAYVFVDNRHFYGTGIHQHALLPGRGAEMFRAGKVMPLGDSLELEYVQRATGRSIAPVSLDRQVYRVNGSEVVHYQPRGQEQLVRQSALTTVNRALAPGFEKNGISFKGTKASSAGKVNSFFKQEGMAPKTTTFKRSSVSSGLAGDAYYRKQKQTLDTLARTRAAGSSAASKGRSTTVGRSSSTASSPTVSPGRKTAPAVSSDRSNGYKPRTGAPAAGKPTPGKSGMVSRGASGRERGRAMSGEATSSGRTRKASPVSTAGSSGMANSRSASRKQAGSVSRSPSRSGKSRGATSTPGRTRTVSRPKTGSSGSMSRIKPPARTRTASRPASGKPAQPSAGSSAKRAPSRGKPAGASAGKRSGASSKGSSGSKAKSGKSR